MKKTINLTKPENSYKTKSGVDAVNTNKFKDEKNITVIAVFTLALDVVFSFLLKHEKVYFLDISAEHFTEIKKKSDTIIKYVKLKYGCILLNQIFISPHNNNNNTCNVGIVIFSDKSFSEKLKNSIQFDVEVFLSSINKKNLDLFSDKNYQANKNFLLNTTCNDFLKKYGGKKLKHPFVYTPGLRDNDELSSNNISDNKPNIMINSLSEKPDTKPKQSQIKTVLANITSLSSTKMILGIVTQENEQTYKKSNETNLIICETNIDDLKIKINDKKTYSVKFELTETLSGKPLRNYISIEEHVEKFELK